MSVSGTADQVQDAKILSTTPVRSFSPAVEDYLKAIYRLQGEADGPVTTSALGDWLGVTVSSASGMLRKLDDLRLIVYAPYHGVRLSQTGRRAALAVVRRHRLLETFLAEILGLSWDQDRQLMGRRASGTATTVAASMITAFVSICAAAYGIDSFLQAAHLIPGS